MLCRFASGTLPSRSAWKRWSHSRTRARAKLRSRSSCECAARGTSFVRRREWWQGRDSNPRHMAYEATALTAELPCRQRRVYQRWLSVVNARKPVRLDAFEEAALQSLWQRAVSSVGRALASHARGRRFKSCTAHHRDARRSGGMADALRSGRSVRKGVGVQIPPSAPDYTWARYRPQYCALVAQSG